MMSIKACQQAARTGSCHAIASRCVKQREKQKIRFLVLKLVGFGQERKRKMEQLSSMMGAIYVYRIVNISGRPSNAMAGPRQIKSRCRHDLNENKTSQSRACSFYFLFSGFFPFFLFSATPLDSPLASRSKSENGGRRDGAIVEKVAPPPVLARRHTGLIRPTPPDPLLLHSYLISFFISLFFLSFFNRVQSLCVFHFCRDFHWRRDERWRHSLFQTIITLLMSIFTRYSYLARLNTLTLAVSCSRLTSHLNHFLLPVVFVSYQFQNVCAIKRGAKAKKKTTNEEEELQEKLSARACPEKVFWLFQY